MPKRTVVVAIGRDARTGRFISVKEAKKRPDTTTVETTIRTPPRSSR